MAQNKVTSDILRCPTVTLMDRSEAHVGHAAVSDSDSQRTRALGGARKNVSKTGTHMRMHEGNSTTMTIQPIVILGRRSNIMINKIYVIHKTITHANARSNCRIHMIQTMRSAKSRLEHRAFSDSDSVSPAF